MEYWLTPDKVEAFVKQRVNSYSLLVNGEINAEMKVCRDAGINNKEENEKWTDVRLFL